MLQCLDHVLSHANDSRTYQVHHEHLRSPAGLNISPQQNGERTKELRLERDELSATKGNTLVTHASSIGHPF